MDSVELSDNIIKDDVNKIIKNETQELINLFLDNSDNEDIVDNLDYLISQDDYDEISTVKTSKNELFIRHSIINLILTIIFGGIGIPAIFYRRKLFGIIVMSAGIISLIVGLAFNFWYLLIINCIMYLFELAWSIHMVVICFYNKKCVKKFSIKFNQKIDDTNIFTEL